MQTALRMLSIGCVVLALWPARTAPGRQEVTWLDQRGRPTEDAHIALDYLRSVEDDGLDAEDFDARQLEVLAASLHARNAPSYDAVAFETELTRNILRYFR